jgi:ribosome-associated protein
MSPDLTPAPRGPKKAASASGKANSAGTAGVEAPAGSAGVEAMRDLILASLDDDKAEEVVVIPLAGRTSIADWMIVASGRSTRQVVAMAAHLDDKLKPLLGAKPHTEGVAQGDWVLVDAGDIIVHLFRPEVRAFYAIEKMWSVDSVAGSEGGNPSGAPERAAAPSA